MYVCNDQCFTSFQRMIEVAAREKGHVHYITVSITYYYYYIKYDYCLSYLVVEIYVYDGHKRSDFL